MAITIRNKKTTKKLEEYSQALSCKYKKRVPITKVVDLIANEEDLFNKIYNGKRKKI